MAAMITSQAPRSRIAVAAVGIASVAFIIASASACRSRPEGDGASGVLLYNGKDLRDGDAYFHGVTKIFYKRQTATGPAEFASTAFLVSPNVLLTSGHTLEGDPFDIEIGLPGRQRFRLGVVKTLHSLNEFKRTYTRGPVWAGGGTQATETWDFGAIVLSGDLLPPWQAVPPSHFPAAVGAPLAIVGTGQNDRSSDWHAVNKIRGDFAVFETDDMMLTYRMDAPGTPFTAVGDSGAPVISRDRVVAIHGGNYADPALSVGYASSVFFGGGAKYFEEIRRLGGKGVDPVIHGAAWMKCVAERGSSLTAWLPLAFVERDGKVSAVAMSTIGWLRKAPFGAGGAVHGAVRDRAPWLEVDQSEPTAGKVELTVIDVSRCRAGRSQTVAVGSGERIAELGIAVDAASGRDAVVSLTSPATGPQSARLVVE
jgi:hypothetical protein